MAVQPSDLLEPTGELSAADFPDVTDVNALLAGFIADAENQIAGKVLSSAAADNAVRAWAYARANRKILRRLSRTPASFTLQNEGSQTMLGEQIRTFKAEAQRWESAFDTIVGDEPPADDVPSAAACTRVVW